MPKQPDPERTMMYPMLIGMRLGSIRERIGQPSVARLCETFVHLYGVHAEAGHISPEFDAELYAILTGETPDANKT